MLGAPSVSAPEGLGFEDNNIPNQLLPFSKRELELEDMCGNSDEQARSRQVEPQVMIGCADLPVGQDAEPHDCRLNFDTVSSESHSPLASLLTLMLVIERCKTQLCGSHPKS